MKVALISFWEDIESLKKIIVAEAYTHIFACEAAAFSLLSEGIHVNAVIGDFDTQLLPSFSELNTLFVVFPEKKDVSDTHAALNFILKKYQNIKKEITLFNDFSGRVDHTLALLSLFTLDNQLKIITPSSKIQYLTRGEHMIKNLRGYKYISFIALEQLQKLTIQGLKYNLDIAYIEAFSDQLISNQFLPSKNGYISFEKGHCLLIYAKDR